MIISSLVPFTPNMTSLSAEIETNRTSSIKYLSFLEKAKLIKMLPSSKKGMNSLNKPEKIYLDNTNSLYALTTSNINDGNKRETFFANQVAMNHTLTIPPKGDFLVDNIYTFETGDTDYCPDTYFYSKWNQLIYKNNDLSECSYDLDVDPIEYFTSFNVMDRYSRKNSLSVDQVKRIRSVIKACPSRWAYKSTRAFTGEE